MKQKQKEKKKVDSKNPKCPHLLQKGNKKRQQNTERKTERDTLTGHFKPEEKRGEK